MMSTGKKGDWEKTSNQLRRSDPCKDGKTWLRHREHSQAGAIDQMLLEGTFSLEEMAVALNRLPYEIERSIGHRIKRIKDHIDHLQEGDPRGGWHGMDPHRLRLKEVGGKWRFDLD